MIKVFHLCFTKTLTTLLDSSRVVKVAFWLRWLGFFEKCPHVYVCEKKIMNMWDACAWGATRVDIYIYTLTTLTKIINNIITSHGWSWLGWWLGLVKVAG